MKISIIWDPFPKMWVQTKIILSLCPVLEKCQVIHNIPSPNGYNSITGAVLITAVKCNITIHLQRGWPSRPTSLEMDIILATEPRHCTIAEGGSLCNTMLCIILCSTCSGSLIMIPNVPLDAWQVHVLVTSSVIFTIHVVFWRSD